VDAGAPDPAPTLASEGRAALARLRLRPTVFFFLYGLLAIAAVLAHRAAAPLTLLALAASARPPDWRAALRRLDPRRARDWLALGLAGLCVWTALAALWSPAPGDADEAWKAPGAVTLGLMALAAWRPLDAAEAARIRWAAASSIALMAGLLAFEGLTDGALRALLSPQPRQDLNLVSLGRGGAILMLLLWPGVALIARATGDWRAGAALIAVGGAAAASLGLASNGLAFTAGLIAFAAALRWPRASLAAVFLALVAALCLSPLVALWMPPPGAVAAWPGPPLTVLQRLVAWSAAGETIADRPIFGAGLEAARALARERILVEFPAFDRAENIMPLHPHNVFLHLWMELGAVGAAFAAALIAGLWRRAISCARTPLDAAMIAACAASFLAYGLSDWSLWQIWRIALLFIAAATIQVALHPELSKMR